MHGQTCPAADWDDAGWLELARQLAELHSFPAPDGAPWNGTPWLERILEQPPVEVAENYWSQTADSSSLGAVLDDADLLAAALAAVPRCFIHGDCHVGNLLLDGPQVVWVDWTVTGVGYPAIDLAALWERAYSDGAAPPYDQMLNTYAAHRGVDADDLRRSMLAALLTTTLFGWPEYAHYHSRTEQQRTTRHLVGLLEDGTTSRPSPSSDHTCPQHFLSARGSLPGTTNCCPRRSGTGQDPPRATDSEHAVGRKPLSYGKRRSVRGRVRDGNCRRTSHR